MLSLCSPKHSTCKHIGQLFHQHEKWPIKWQLNYLHALYNLVCGDLFLYHVFHLRWGFPLISLSSRSYFKLSRPHHCGDKGCCYVCTVLSLINVSVSQYTLFLNRAFSWMLCHHEATIMLSMECMNCIEYMNCWNDKWQTGPIYNLSIWIKSHSNIVEYTNLGVICMWC